MLVRTETNIVERYDQALCEVVELLACLLDEREGKARPFTPKEKLTVEPRIHELLREIRLDVVHILEPPCAGGLLHVAVQRETQDLLDQHHDPITFQYTLTRSLLDGLREAYKNFCERPPKLATPRRKLGLALRKSVPMTSEEIKRAIAELKLNCDRVVVAVHTEMRRRWRAGEVRPLGPLGPNDDPNVIHELVTTAAAAAGYGTHYDPHAMLTASGHFGFPEVREISSIAVGWPITDEAWQIIVDCGQRLGKWDYESRRPYVWFIDDAAKPTAADNASAPTYVPTTYQLAILTVLAEAKSTLKQEDICAALDPPHDRKTVGQCLAALESAGYVSRPRGERKGYAITDSGRALLPPPNPKST